MAEEHQWADGDLTAHQPDSQEFWIHTINFRASNWSGNTSFSPQYPVPPPQMVPGYPVSYSPTPYQYPYPSTTLYTHPLPPIATGYAWPMDIAVPQMLPAPGMAERYPDTTSIIKMQEGYQLPAKLKTWYVVVLVVVVVFVVSSLVSLLASQTSTSNALNWVDQVPTTPGTWNQLCPRTVPSDGNPYAIVGKTDLSVDFVNKILAHYHSPAAGEGQKLIEATSQCGIKVGAALAFFMHESSLGTQGEATSTYSLGNMRCIQAIKFLSCVDQDRGGYAQMPSWAVGFAVWSRMMRNQYVDQWGEETIDQIIPTYAPTSDNNSESGYISSWKYCIDSWHSGVLAV